ncbi:hypothetical protein M23134_01199 [Microscilla marina ATCC 23134]|uniref:Uncharacterized protein n=1 Tax=Microscilla marina ATCC 23134 TaxID=313606 RepID=A1ZFV1_MICM2|nr:hypothetical protein M23134_01199 [Microscilla marina ATCC 23134]
MFLPNRDFLLFFFLDIFKVSKVLVYADNQKDIYKYLKIKNELTLSHNLWLKTYAMTNLQPKSDSR